MIIILHFGDITQIDGHKVPIVDVITGGSPCQDLSVAGLRKGLEGERSGLFMEQMRIVKEMRNECRKQQAINGAISTVSSISPRYLVWENVPGAFSSGNPAGADFQAVLEEIVRVVTDKAPSVPIPEDGWSYAGNLEGVGDDGTPFSVCWRTVDAQYWGKSVIDNSGRVVKRGTPQRRRRISLVADFGGNTAPEILFERTGLSGNPKQSREEGQATPGATGTSVEKSGTNGVTAICIGNGQVDNAVTPEVELSKTLNCMQDPMKVMVSPTSEDTIRTYKKDSHAKNSEDGQGWVETEVNDTLNAFDNGEKRTPTLVFDMLNLNPKDDDKCQTLNAYNGTGGNNMPLVYENHSQDTRYKELGDVCTTVSATFGMGGNNTPFVVENSNPDAPKVYDWHRQDTRATELGDVCTTVQAAYGSGGNNMPYVVQNSVECPEKPSVNILNPDDSQGQQIADSDGYQAGYMLDKTKEPILLESSQNHATIQTGGVSTTLPTSMGEGGGYVPMVVDEPKSEVKQEGCDLYNGEITGDVASTVTAACGGTNTSGPKIMSYGFEPGAARRLDPENRFNEEVSPTLRAEMGDNQAAVVYGMSAYDSNAMKSSNPHSGIYKADTSRTLDLNGGNPACNQGGMMVVQDSNLTEFEKTQVEDWVNAVNSSAKHQQDLIQSDLGVAHTIAPGTHASGPHLTKTLVTSAISDNPIKESVKSYGVTAKGNGDAFIAEERHTALSTGGGEPGQGYPCVLTTPTDTPDKCLNPWEHQGKHIQSENGVAETLYAGESRYGGGEAYVLQTTAFAQNEREEVRDLNDVAGAISAEPGTHQQTYVAQTYQDTTGALCAAGYSKLGTQEASNGMYVVQKPTEVISMTDCGFQDVDQSGVAFTLRARDYKVPQTVAVDMGGGKSSCSVLEETAPTLATTHYGEPAVLPSNQHSPKSTPLSKPVVRRLTPLECTRLQGFPDGWVDIGDWVDTNGKNHKDSDSAKYKALGNSICLPYWNWLAGRMCEQLRKSGVEHPTMASLFSGIGGFEFVYKLHGCEPIWSSEIEEFPIAVTKKHFGDDETGEKGDYEQYINQQPMVGHSNTPDVCYGLDRASFNQGQNAKYDFSVENDLAQTLVSRGPGGG